MYTLHKPQYKATPNFSEDYNSLSPVQNHLMTDHLARYMYRNSGNDCEVKQMDRNNLK